MRKSFQGISNIIRFNWPYFAWSIILLISLIIISTQINNSYRVLALSIFLIILLINILSLLVSFYIYDCSSLYQLTWLNDIPIGNRIINITAGFDETSILIKNKFPQYNLKVLDFFNPEKHTEPSIKRARKAYPAYPNTIKVNTDHLPFVNRTIDTAFALFSVHEIRNQEERNVFFKELNRVLVPNGRVIITEHLRDAANFLAYSIGFLHFHSEASWFKTFKNANFHIVQTIKITPFVTTYILKKNDIES